MSPTATSGTPSSDSRSPEEQFRVVRKRNRVPVSCHACRTKKRCDRGHPCSNCVKRDGQNTTSCSYASPVSRRRGHAAHSPDDMQNRIDRLENLVLSLMHSGSNVDPATAASAAGIVPGLRTAVGGALRSAKDGADGAARGDEGGADGVDETGADAGADDVADDESDTDDGLATSLGVLKVDADRGKSMYLGQENWHTILADIAEVKHYFTVHKQDLEKSYERVMQSKPANAKDAPTFLLGAVPATEADLRAELPPKSTVLTLCGRYFNSMDNAVNIIHAPTFNAQLRSHWQNPSKTPIMWLGLLYSVMCLAMLSFHKVGDEPPEWKGRSMEMASLFRTRTVQCLVTADYTRPAEYTVETMILYVFGEYSSRWDADVGLWLIGSVITRLAFRMGYHRDAKWFPSITPFQAEMRRRTWALVRVFDVMFSHQVSLPNMIYDHDCDTQLPLNIFDEEFGPNTKVLPPSRPSSEPTPISYMIAKVKLCLELGNILQATTRVGKPVPYEEILRFDTHLRQIKADLPAHLKLQPLEGSRDLLTLIIARFNIEILFQKVVCLLHRKYLVRARQNPRYAQSRRRAIEAAMETLHHLQMLNKESQGNGRLRSIRWYVASIATKDFLLPAMLVAVEVRYESVVEKEGRPGETFWTPEQRAEMVAMLQATKEIWRPLADGSMEAFKAYNIIRVVLDKMNVPPAAVDPKTRSTESCMGPGLWDMAKGAQVTTGAETGTGPGTGSAAKSTPSDFSSNLNTPATSDSTHTTQTTHTPQEASGGGAFPTAATTAAATTAATAAPAPAALTMAPPSLLGGMVSGTGADPAPSTAMPSLFGATLAGAAQGTPDMLDPTLAAAFGSGGLPPPDLNGDMLSSLTSFGLYNSAAMGSIPNIMDDSMDFTSNFDWNGVFAVQQPLPFFSDDPPYPAPTESSSADFAYGSMPDAGGADPPS